MSLIKKIINIYFNIKSKTYQVLNINKFKEAKTFLVISNTALGDTILSSPAIKSLKSSFPNSKIVALFKTSFAPIFKDLDYIDDVILYDGKYKNFFNTINQIKKIKPDIALILHSNSPQDIELCVLSNIPFILKHPNKSELKKFLSYDFEKKNQHTIEDRLDLVRIIGGKNIDKNMEVSKLTNNKYIEKYKQFQDYIGFQIGAADMYKMWPIENFIKLADKIKSNIIITGIASESNLAEEIIEKSQNKNIINLCGQISIEELPYIINNLKLLITNDTGTMHLAIALKTPTLSLFSPTDSTTIGPYQDLELHKVVQKDGSYIQKLPKKERSDEAMRLISVNEVYEKYLEMI
jgi:ADP-heptose:LPS heptosyltransferase